MENEIKTEWLGLWESGTSDTYTSKAFPKKDVQSLLKGKGERKLLMVRKNRYWSKGSNRPKFVFCFADCNSARMDVDVKNSIKNHEFTFEEVVKVEDALDIARALLHSHDSGGSLDDLVIEAEGLLNEKSATALIDKRDRSWEE